MIEEVQKRQEILKTESKLWKENRYFSENSTDEEFDTNRRPSFKSVIIIRFLFTWLIPYITGKVPILRIVKTLHVFIRKR